MSTLQRLGARGRSLALESSHIDGLNPLIDAVRSVLQIGVAFPHTADRQVILTHRVEGGAADALAMIQLVAARPGNHPRVALVTYASPAPNTDQSTAAWEALIDAAQSLAASELVRFMVAEVPEDSREEDIFRANGFVPIIHQDLLKLTPTNRDRVRSHSPGSQPSVPVEGMRVQAEKDDLHIRLLAGRVIPKVAAMHMGNVDPTRILHQTRTGYLLMHAQEACGHVSINRGRRARCMRLLFRHDLPEIEPKIAPMLESVIRDESVASGQTIYCMLPSYLSWLLPILDELGFVHVMSTSTMLKHMTAVVRTPVWQAKKIPAAAGLIRNDHRSRFTRT